MRWKPFWSLLFGTFLGSELEKSAGACACSTSRASSLTCQHLAQESDDLVLFPHASINIMLCVGFCS